MLSRVPRCRRQRQLLLPTMICVVLCGLAFFTGRQFPVTGSHEDIARKSKSGAITLISTDTTSEAEFVHGIFPGPTIERFKELIRSPRTNHRTLEIQLGIEHIDPEGAQQLWDFSVGRLNFSNQEDFEIAAAILGRIAKLNPAMALELAARDSGAWKSQLQREIIATWSLIDQRSALTWLSQSGSGVRDKAAQALLEQLGDRDREAAIVLFREMVEDQTIARTSWEAPQFFNEWAKEDPLRAAEAALEHSEFTGSDAALRAAIRGWAAARPEEALTWLNSNDSDIGNAMVEALTKELISTWSDHAPLNAAEYVKTFKDDGLFHSTAREILRDWALIDFDEAARWIERFDDEDRRKNLETMLADGGRIDGDREKGLTYALQKFSENGRLSHSIYLLVGQTIGDDIPGSISWIREIAPSELLYEEFANTLLHQWRMHDPAEAVKHLDLMPDPIRRANMYDLFASQYAEQDIKNAREWANSLPESNDRDRALLGVAQVWLERDPSQALEWTQSLENGELKDRITAHHIGEIAEQDVPTALQLARELDNPFRRDAQLEFVMSRWLEVNRAAATVAIEESSELSATSKWRLLQGGDES